MKMNFFRQIPLISLKNQHLIGTLKKIEKIVEIFSKNFENSEVSLEISENCGHFLEISINIFWKFRKATGFFRKF